MIAMLYLTETRREGNYVTGGVLFVSSTNSVDVKFTSDSYLNQPGFMLDARSIPCADRDTLTLAEQHSSDGGYTFCNPPQEVVISAGEVLEDAIAMETDSDGNYLKDTYEKWNIVTDENQVFLRFPKVHVTRMGFYNKQFKSLIFNLVSL